jgi:CHASE2 domain-containing sensor protein
MLTHLSRRNTNLFSCLISGCRLRASRKIFYLLALILSLIMIESYIIYHFGWKEAIGQSPLMIVFLGVASVQIWDYITELIKNLHR